MKDNLQIHTNRTSNKFSIKKVIQRTNKSVDFISNQAFQSEQKDKKVTHYSKSMLCGVRSTPKVSISQSRYDLSKFKQSVKFSSFKRVSKTFRNSPNHSNKSNTHSLSQSRGIQYYTNQSFGNNLFLTQNDNKVHSFKNKRHFRSDNLSMKNIKFEQFLNRLYLQKVRDLRGKPNKRQQLLFVERFKSKFIFYDGQELLKIDNSRDKQQSTVIMKQISVLNSDLGLNSIKWLCEYMLLNKLQRGINIRIDNTCCIKTLVLDQNSLGDQALCILAELLTHCNLLEKLSLVSVNMSPKGANKLLQSLIGISSLKQLNLSSVQGLNRNRFGDSIQLMQKVLIHQKCLIQKLNMSNVNIGNRGLKIISNGINKQSKLQQLVIADNNINSQEIPYFLQKIKLTHLKFLDLSNNKIGDQGFRLISEKIGSSQRNNFISRSIKSLNLSSNQITSYGIDSYCKIMYHNQSLTHLYLANNPLSKGSIFYNFKYYISRNWTLKILDLTQCFTISDDMRHLFEGLEQNRALEYVKLNKNNFSQQTFIFMVRMLNINKSLKSLELQSCNLTDKFFQRCYKQLIFTKSIQQLNMNNNYLSDKSGNILLKMINNSRSIVKLSILKNCIGTRIQQQIMYSLSGNRGRKQNLFKVDDKQIQYLHYVSETQARHQESIKNTIQRLQQKQQKAKMSSLIREVVKVQIQQEQYQKQLQQQMLKIKQLQKKLNTSI